MVITDLFDIHLSEDIINDPYIVILNEEKGKTTPDYEFQLLGDEIQYNLNIYRANINKIANILNNTLLSTGDYETKNFETISKDMYSLKEPEDSKKLYFIKNGDSN